MNKKIYTILGVLAIIFLSLMVLVKPNKKNKELTTVKVAEVAHSIFYAPQYAAINNGYFEDYGIDIDLTLASGADKVIAAVLSNDVNIGFSGIEATIYVYNGGEKDHLKTLRLQTGTGQRKLLHLN